MRLFIAVNFNEEIKSRLVQIRDRIGAQTLRGNFSRPENLHLTLVFLGETPADEVPAICSIMADAQRTLSLREFTLDFTHTGCFKRRNRELWWIAAEKTDPALGVLAELRRRLTGGLLAAGIAFDNRPFNAHITLGREIKHSSPIVLPGEKITAPINRICLMKSEHTGGVLVYTAIFAVDLQREETSVLGDYNTQSAANCLAKAC
ncbi:MAG: RNA 2',3'-cyclic phosphodiesterase [Treponema sp.]|jgi:2'-5' RNA ligase|nr:RNA 2',3'-cyclic phosphodiesterase [Treponema sp.]